MSLKDRIKAFINPREYIAASMRKMSGIGNGPKPRPFNYEAALRQFRHWAYAAAMLNATAVANVPLRLYVRNRSSAKRLYETRPLKRWEKTLLADDAHGPAVRRKVAEFGGDVSEVIEPHPAIEVLRKVNGFQNGYELTLLRMFDLQITGNSYLLPIYGAAGVPDQVWRMPPQWTKVVPDKASWIRGYKYGADDNSASEFAADAVDHFKLPNPRDMYYGMGWFEAAWSAIGLHDSKRTLDLSKFDNMARPDYIVSVKNGARKEAVDALEAKINETLRGPKNASKFLAIGAEVELKQLNENVPEVGTPNRVIEEISAVSGVPVAMLLSNDPNRANSVTARIGWYRSTIRPYCKLDEEKLNERWIPRFAGSEDYFVAYDMVSFEDKEALAKQLVGYVAGGMLTPNEGRAEIGYDPIDGGDQLYAPAGATGAQAAIAGDLAAQQNTGN